MVSSLLERVERSMGSSWMELTPVEHGHVAGERDGLDVRRVGHVGLGLCAAAVDELHLERHDLVLDDLHRHLDRVGAERQLGGVDRIAVLVEQDVGDGLGDGLIDVAAVERDLGAVDGTHDGFRAFDGDGVIVEARAVEHEALGDADVGEIALDLDRLADLPLDGEGDAGGGLVRPGDGGGGDGAAGA